MRIIFIRITAVMALYSEIQGLIQGFKQTKKYLTTVAGYSRNVRNVLRMGTTADSAQPVSSDVFTVPMPEIVSLCKKRGFIFQSSEIYNGFNGFYDYGPLGAEMKRNIKNAWWKDIVHCRSDIVGLDSSIIASPSIWKASGHVAGFSDPMVDCKESKNRYRADQLFFSEVVVEGEILGYVSLLESGSMDEEAMAQAQKMKKKMAKQGFIEALKLRDITEATAQELALIPSPATGNPTLTPPRAFNLMFQTSVGAMTDASSVAYLRPETAQGIFTNFKNVLTTARAKIPFGIAQIGKAFRNEITPRNFIFRSREFEQMEIEYFIEPEDDVWEQYHERWIQESWDWLVSIGLREDLMAREVHAKDKLAHYARACTDIIFRFPFGWSELQGIAARGNYDLTQHQEASGKGMEYFDEANKRKYLPHVIEPSLGVDRLMLALICSAYHEDEVDGEKRTLLRFHPRIAPIKVAVFPLVKNKPEIVAKSEELFKTLQKRGWNSIYDSAGAIGRRYRRMDEAGTPFCVTVDFDTLENDSVTVRDRDSTQQIRMQISELIPYLSKNIDGF